MVSFTPSNFSKNRSKFNVRNFYPVGFKRTYMLLFNLKKGGFEKISQGHFNSGREKGFQQWSKNIYYVGSKGNGARIYYRFVPDKFKVEILVYSNKAKQTAITNRMMNLYGN